MKNFIKNNFYTLEEIVDKTEKSKSEIFLYRKVGINLLLGVYYCLFCLTSISFVFWIFDFYPYIIRTLFVCIIVNILIFKK